MPDARRERFRTPSPFAMAPRRGPCAGPGFGYEQDPEGLELQPAQQHERHEDDRGWPERRSGSPSYSMSVKRTIAVARVDNLAAS